MRVMVQLRAESAVSEAVAAHAQASRVTTLARQAAPSVDIDPGFAPVLIPGLVGQPPGARLSLDRPMMFSLEREDATQLVRGTVDDEPGAVAAAMSSPEVAGIFADPVIEGFLVCPGDPAVGTDADVARLLDVASLTAEGLTGAGVPLAIVDTGVNLAHLQSKGQSPTLDTPGSWTPAGVTTQPGAHPMEPGGRAHGTMCAYDAGIAAPAATLLDHAVLLSQTAGATAMSGLLSDAVLSYSHLLSQLVAQPEDKRAMVVSNSWGMFDPQWDFPVGHPGNYSDNPAHPFNVIVASLDNAGADILFAAGNCGRDCPDGRCAFGAAPPIVGANSHPRVLSVAGIDVNLDRVGYSSQGPGRLDTQKPDIVAPTHFVGSEAFGTSSADGGTSTSCPVAAGVIAAIRSRYPASKITPMKLQSLIFKTATDLGGPGFEFDHGWGMIDTPALLKAVEQAATGKPAPPPYRGRLLRHPPLTQGEDVLLWQQRMVELGYGLVPDGKYGPKSKQVCIDFQQQRGLKTDGIVGPVTWEESFRDV